MASQPETEQRFQLLTEVLQLLIASNNDPQTVEPLLQQKPALLDDDMMEVLRDWSKSELAKADTNQQKLLGQALITLGNVLGQFPWGNKAINMELQIRCYSLASKVFQDAKELEQWAELQNLLAIAYKQRIRGDKADNLEFSIEQYKFVLEAYRGKKTSIELAEAEDNLAVAYRERSRGDQAENLEISIEHTKLAQEILIDFLNSGIEFYCADNKEKLLFLWALGQNNLAHAYRERLAGNRSENLSMSINCYQLALEVYTENSFPVDWFWLETQNKLNNINEIIHENEVQNLEQPIDLNLQFSHAYQYRGFLKQEKLNDLAGALVDYHKALERSPDFALEHEKILGKCSVEQNKAGSDPATVESTSSVSADQLNDVSAEQSAAKNNPNFNEAIGYINSAILKESKLNDLAGALADYNQAIALNPNNALAYSNRATLKKNKLNDVVGALADYNQAIDLNPQDIFNYAGRAVLKGNMLNDVEGALIDYSQAISIDPNDALAYFGRGTLKQNKLNDRTGAIQDLQQAVRIYREQGQTKILHSLLKALQQLGATE
jgi:tetratricopeptide (TPR) repeat protein